MVAARFAGLLTATLACILPPELTGCGLRHALLLLLLKKSSFLCPRTLSRTRTSVPPAPHRKVLEVTFPRCQPRPSPLGCKPPNAGGGALPDDSVLPARHHRVQPQRTREAPCFIFKQTTCLLSPRFLRALGAGHTRAFVRGKGEQAQQRGLTKATGSVLSRPREDTSDANPTGSASPTRPLSPCVTMPLPAWPPTALCPSGVARQPHGGRRRASRRP